MKKIKLLLTGLGFSLIALTVGCETASETAKKVTQDVEEIIQAEITKDNDYLLSVKGGYLNAYPDLQIEEAFDNFFSSPTWKYFEAETGEQVVEFTGYCFYLDKKVKAKLQFIVEEGNDSFEIGALEFNEIPQDELTKFALLSAIYEGDQDETELISDPDPNLAGNDWYFIEKAINGYMVELDLETIGNILAEPLFGDSTWSVNEYGDVIFEGNYSGEIVPGEASTLQFVLSEVDADYYSISSLTYNGEEVSGEGFAFIMELIGSAILY